MKQQETNFKERVCRDLKSLGTECWFVKTQFVAKRGIPDIIGCINGVFFALELKATKKSIIAPLQLWTLECISASRGIGFVVYPENWKATYQVLEELKLGMGVDDLFSEAKKTDDLERSQ